MSSHMEPEVIGTIWFDDASSYPQTVTLIEAVSELLWGANDDGTREPFTIEETIERLREFSNKAHAWDEMVEWHAPSNEYDSQHYWEMRELMDAIMKEVSE